MDALSAELQRLYCLPGQTPVGNGRPGALGLVGGDGRMRTLVLAFRKAADWDRAAGLHAALTDDFGLPALAVAVSGRTGYQLWLSLAEPIPVELARAFVDALRRRYLADLPPADLVFVADAVELVPMLCEETGKWSAFIDPGMGSLFAEEPGLDMAPNPDKQAELLAGLESVAADDFRRALERLRTEAAPAADSAAVATGTVGATRGLAVGSGFGDPISFLLAVMNDVVASPEHRIEAAKALLPYFQRQGER